MFNKNLCPATEDVPGLNSYDKIIVAFSGGKDSLACVLHLLELGVSRDRIELWHHDVDGREGSHLMDWPCTASYCKSIADGIGIKIYFSWKNAAITRRKKKESESGQASFFDQI